MEKRLTPGSFRDLLHAEDGATAPHPPGSANAIRVHSIDGDVRVVESAKGLIPGVAVAHQGGRKAFGDPEDTLAPRQRAEPLGERVERLADRLGAAPHEVFPLGPRDRFIFDPSASIPCRSHSDERSLQNTQTETRGGFSDAFP